MEKGAGNFSQGESSPEKNRHIVRNQREGGYIFLLTKLSSAKRGLREVVGRLAALISQSNKKKINPSMAGSMLDPENRKLNNAQTLTPRSSYSSRG